MECSTPVDLIADFQRHFVVFFVSHGTNINWISVKVCKCGERKTVRGREGSDRLMDWGTGRCQ